MIIGLVLSGCHDPTNPQSRLSPTDGMRSLQSTVVTVSPSAMQGWYYYNDQTGSVCADVNVCRMVSGPAGQPAGAGSAELATAVGSDGKALISAAYQGVRLDRITSLRYSTHRQTADAGNNLAIALQFNVD